MYYYANRIETIYSLLVVKNGSLIAEKYFNSGSIEEMSKRASVTKSYTSALVGIALDKGYISSIDQKMLEFFPGKWANFDKYSIRYWGQGSITQILLAIVTSKYQLTQSIFVTHWEDELYKVHPPIHILN
jgi:hypothetical protein